MKLDQLSCDSILCTPFDVAWMDAFRQHHDTHHQPAIYGAPDPEEARAQLILPSFDDASAEECELWISQHDLEAFDPPTLDAAADVASLAEMDRAELVAALEGLGTACYEDEATSLLREALAEQLRDEARDQWEEDLRTWCGEHVETVREQAPDAWEPVMSYAYPLPNFTRDAGELQLDLDLYASCVVAVELDGETVLALSGGGQDLSWEVCEAYMIAGYRPPLHFCRLPQMAGYEQSERSARLLRACIESAEIAQRWAGARETELRAMLNECEAAAAAEA